MQEEILSMLDYSSFVVFRGAKNAREGMVFADQNDNPNCLKLCRDGRECEKRSSCPFTHLKFEEGGTCTEDKIFHHMPLHLLPEAFLNLSIREECKDELNKPAVPHFVAETPNLKGEGGGPVGSAAVPRKRRRRRRKRKSKAATSLVFGGQENNFNKRHQRRPYPTYATPPPPGPMMRTGAMMHPYGSFTQAPVPQWGAGFTPPRFPRDSTGSRFTPRRLDYGGRLTDDSASHHLHMPSQVPSHFHPYGGAQTLSMRA